jgi:Zn-dependent protease with chaperone function
MFHGTGEGIHMNYSFSEKELVHKKETSYYILCLILSGLFTILLFLSMIGWFFLAISIVLPILAHAISIAHIRMNGVKLGPKQFPEVYEIVLELSRRMNLQQAPDVYVIESGGLLNAFATRFFGRNMVVLYSDVFELTLKDGSSEVSFVIAHELAHIKRNHITKNLLILPALWIPFLGVWNNPISQYIYDKIRFYNKNGTITDAPHDVYPLPYEEGGSIQVLKVEGF